MIVRYSGTSGGTVSVSANLRPTKLLGFMPNGASKEIGWIELGTELHSGDSVQVLVNGKHDQLATIP